MCTHFCMVFTLLPLFPVTSPLPMIPNPHTPTPRQDLFPHLVLPLKKRKKLTFWLFQIKVTQGVSMLYFMYICIITLSGSSPLFFFKAKQIWQCHINKDWNTALDWVGVNYLGCQPFANSCCCVPQSVKQRLIGPNNRLSVTTIHIKFSTTQVAR
jgi:hypothetical protein